MNTIFGNITKAMLILSIIWPIHSSCNRSESLLESEGDSAKIVKASLENVFKIVQFAPEYYEQPVRIIKSRNVPDGLDFPINGKRCLIVEKPNDSVYADWQNPVSFVEVEKLKFNNKESVNVDLVFRATGHWFMLTLKRDEKSNWEVEKMTQATI